MWFGVAPSSFGVPALDAQHRPLFALRNALECCCLGPNADHSERFHEVLAALYSYSITHFAAEEAYMESIGYSGQAAHAREHLHFIEVLADFNLAAAFDQRSTQAALNFLLQWLVTHIKSADGAIRTFMYAR